MDYYDRDGQPITMERWARLHANMDYQRVAEDYVPDESGLRVSTIWLGLNHNFAPGEPPLAIFETRIFAARHSAGEAGDYLERYATVEAARAGHDRAVMWAREHWAKALP